MPSSPLRVFVYGTLKPGQANYPRYCQGKTTHEQPALVRGALYSLPVGYPALTSGSNWIKGFLLEFPNVEPIGALDDLEDYEPQRSPTANLYNRRSVDVYTTQHNFLDLAWVYRMDIHRIQAMHGQLLEAGVWPMTSD